MSDRQQRLVALIEQAMGKSVYRGDDTGNEIEAERDSETAEAALTMAAA